MNAVPGARGAAFADWEGETVGSYCHGEEEQQALLAAHWGIVFTQARAAIQKTCDSSVQQMIVELSHGLVVVQRVTADYFVVLNLDRDGHLGRALRALEMASERLREAM